jgi:NDP-sugar pyrophosphorylase family protein
MQTVILAGGKGIRLRPFTYKIPKPMFPINNRPFLHYQLDIIKEYGLNDILILEGYLGSKIRDYFGNGSKFGLNINYSHERGFLGTGGALKKAEEKLKSEFLLLNGDTYLQINYRDLINYFYQVKKMGVITVYNNLDHIAPNNVRVDENNVVTDYNKKCDNNMNYLDAGIVVFNKDAINFIKNNKGISLEEEVFPELIKINELIAYPVNQRFYDMGSLQGLRLLEENLK